jgi:hypothetical protein
MRCASALEACAAALRAAPVDPPGFVLLLPTSTFWKNYLVRIAFGAMVNSSRYEIVSTDSQKIGNHLDDRVHRESLLT